MTTLACWFLAGAALAASPTASSVGKSADGVAHPPSHAFDGLLSTAWAEGELGEGKGSWIEVRFDRPVDIRSVSIWPGWMGGANRDLRLHGRPRDVTLTFDVVKGPDVVEKDVVLDPGEAQRPLRHDIRVDVPNARKLRITVDDVYSGGIYSDMYIAEIALNLVEGEPVGQVAQVRDWLSSDSGQAAEERHVSEVTELYDKIRSDEFGDRESLRTLMDWGADGAPFLRRRVAARVPAGFRLNALLPDKHALEHLMKIKDANAVSAFERAALRTTGGASSDLARAARLLQSYAQLLTGGRPRIDPWGEEGFEKGALRSFSEPLAVAVDEYGGLYVADTFNHRLQRFSLDTGLPEQQWGANEPAISDFWFGDRREFYPSGLRPTREEGGFIHPLDVKVVGGRLGDDVYVLDYAQEPDKRAGLGRVTHIKYDGTVVHRQDLPFASPVRPRRGGEAFLIVEKRKATVIWRDEGITYSLPDWEEGERFPLKDGSPNGAIALKGKKIGLIYGEELVMYSTDGFRHGVVLGAESLGVGFEDWDLAYDESGKLWAVLDTGEVIKFKRLGKVDYRFQLSDQALSVPRIDVYGDLVFVSSGDRIVRGDAKQLFTEQAEDKAERGTLDVGGN